MRVHQQDSDSPKTVRDVAALPVAANGLVLVIRDAAGVQIASFPVEHDAWGESLILSTIHGNYRLRDALDRLDVGDSVIVEQARGEA